MTETLDTSAVLRLLTGEPATQAEQIRRLLEHADGPVVVESLVIAESHFALRHHYGVPHREAVQALLDLLSSDRVRAAAESRVALVGALTTEHPGVMDRLILEVARANARTLLTFDRQLARLDGARLIA